MNLSKRQLPKKILLVRCDRIGDLLLTVPVISYIRQRWNGAQISMLVHKNTADLIKGHPQLEEVLILDKKGTHRGLIGTWCLVQQLRKRKFDVAMVIHPTARVHWIVFLAGIACRVGYPVKGGKWLLTDLVPDRRSLDGKHEVENVMSFIDHSPQNHYSFWIAQDPQAQQKIDKSLLDAGVQPGKPVIALHPGASDPCKCWPKERFVEVGKYLKEQYGFEIVVVAGPSDGSVGREIAEEIQGALDFSGKTTLLELAALLRRSKLLISNDSGPVHMAVSVGTPVISLFGRNQPGLGPSRWRPLGEHDRYLFKDVGSETENLSAITVEEVVKEATEILKEQGVL